MTALGDVGTYTQILPNSGVTMLQVRLADTVIGGTDTVTVDMTTYGCTQLSGIIVFDETTTGSVVVSQAPTTTVSAGVVTITLGGSDTGEKTIILWCR